MDGGNGRVYLIVVSATDSGCAVAFGAVTVVVPKSNSQNNQDAVTAAAAAAKAFADANNEAPPAGYFVIGDGPRAEAVVGACPGFFRG